ncbi:hypothetical protein V1277_005297 [Bradyrhizobium sp. AZCC 1588]
MARAESRDQPVGDHVRVGVVRAWGCDLRSIHREGVHESRDRRAPVRATNRFRICSRFSGTTQSLACGFRSGGDYATDARRIGRASRSLDAQEFARATKVTIHVVIVHVPQRLIARRHAAGERFAPPALSSVGNRRKSQAGAQNLPDRHVRIYLIRTQAPLLADEFTAASMNFTPARPSSTVGKITAGSGGLPACAARIARAASV